MSVREIYESELTSLNNKIIELGKFAQKALERSLVALENQDIDLALSIMDEDIKANQLEEEINDQAILLIAKQQPVATDLRRVIVAIKIAADLERIADFGVNIAKSTIRIGNEPLVKPIASVREMHNQTTEMIGLVIEAFIEEDIVKAKRIAELDDTVDSLYGQTIQELLSISAENNNKLPQITQLSFICRYLERAADHVTNISENIFYLVKGRRYDLNK
ncbi:phosphate signaling complex protein PhoU [Jeotgalibacillus proteolyticus]|uniref:Phosphate-specific transport system accessory protein PhoU n=1 Tax=Jeotgalibacillus proteolyticus TaxID=2082395 RepID=A0A2S5GFF7_9BACL|nr:phosphate signaling complex protein PhoU [Jeotgalibacillus proteolyticus]PPA71777.1 phosphate transport system regulatory protein PhoU [Jeotgalibacillus proteolyticus]